MRRERFFFGGLLLAAALIAYIPALRAGYIWDDDAHVTDNPTLTSLGGLRAIWLDPDALPQYYPLVHTTFWVERRLWGLAPFGYHLVNVLLHALNALLLCAALERLSVPGVRLAAFIFALHPVHVESVAWITERKNVLSAFFYLAASLCLLRFYRVGPPAQAVRGLDAPAWSLYALAFVLYVCALLSKTVSATLPLAILILLWWKRDRLSWREAAPLGPFLLVGAALGSVTAWIEKHHVGAKGEPWNLSFLERILVAGRAVWFYVEKLVWPARLTFFYPRWHIDAGSLWQYLFPLAAAGTIIALWTLRVRAGKGPLAAALFFGVTLVPALGFFDVFPMRYSYVADHFQYLASAAPIALLAALGTTLWAKRRSDAGSVSAAYLAAALPLLLLGALTWRQCSVYKDAQTLWRDTIAKNPDAWMAHNNLGILLAQRGDVRGAISEYSLALEQNPDLIEAYNNLGDALTAEGRMAEAATAFGEAVRREPQYLMALYNLGSALFKMQKYAEAVERLSAALRLEPEFVQARDMLAVALHRAGREEEALAQRAEVLRFKAWIRATHEDPALRSAQEAIDFAQGACSITGYKQPLPLDALAAAYAEAGRFPEAIETARRAIDLARVTGPPELPPAIEGRLKLYEAGRPFRDTSLSRIGVDTRGRKNAGISP